MPVIFQDGRVAEGPSKDARARAESPPVRTRLPTAHLERQEWHWRDLARVDKRCSEGHLPNTIGSTTLHQVQQELPGRESAEPAHGQQAPAMRFACRPRRKQSALTQMISL